MFCITFLKWGFINLTLTWITLSQCTAPDCSSVKEEQSVTAEWVWAARCRLRGTVCVVNDAGEETCLDGWGTLQPAGQQTVAHTRCHLLRSYDS